MKNKKFIIALLIIVLFIPAYIAIANFIYIKSTPVTLDSATEIQIKDNISGLVYIEKPNSDIGKLINEIINGNKSIKSDLPTALAGENNFIISSVDGARKTDTLCYILKDSLSGYFVNSQGAAYKMDQSHVAAFLETKYAQSLYSDAYVPALTNGDNEILPSDYTWTYTTASGNSVIDASVTKKADGTVTYTSMSGASLSFARQPDTFTVKVTGQNSGEIYSGDYANLTGIDTKKDSVITIEADAEWNESETMPHGSASYKFVIDIAAQPEFAIVYSGSKDEEYAKFEPGDIALITAVGINNPGSITFTSNPTLTHEGKEIVPVFYNEGKNCYAFLPTSYDTAPGEYEFVFSYDGIDYPVTVILAKKKFTNASEYSISKGRITATYTADTLAAYDEFVETTVNGNDSSAKYFTSEKFTIANSGYAGGGLRGYGKPRPVPALKENYLNKGMEFTMYNGSKVLAVMDGKVIKVAYTAFSGDIIVIDHGYGLYSWYHNLDKDSITVKEGDTVKNGDVICSKIGDSGFTDGKTLHFRLTVGTVPVYASDFSWGSGIEF
ncbi:MAG: M23 family metallopeptidase [Ruminococcaceae bacterium]|nr:M23 family metallopeptidase [Oscillospiraceae bacterium]